MSLYHETATVLAKTLEPNSGSIESIVFGRKDWKSSPKQLFALSFETARWSQILAKVVDHSELLVSEKQLTPCLALALTHDLLLSKKGLSIPATHGLAKAIIRHKARLAAELTKVRIKEDCCSIEALKEKLAHQAAFEAGLSNNIQHPRWIRINSVLTTFEEQITTTFKNHTRVFSVTELNGSTRSDPPKLIYHDEHVPNLVALPPGSKVTHYKAYGEGKIILQDKASCFPAYLLDHAPANGLAIDACAAPGNKTTHLAAINGERLTRSEPQAVSIIACEKDVARSQTLKKLVKLAGAESLVQVKQGQDFLRLDPQFGDLVNVTSLLLDPSCSGSGIVGRDEGGTMVHMPVNTDLVQSRKRKRTPAQKGTHKESVDQLTEAQSNADYDKRLESLADFQLRILQHAMAFPAATRITYSTCSLHAKENEEVVCHALLSDVAQRRGWRILLRDQQITGMKAWHLRGDEGAVKLLFHANEQLETITSVRDLAQACIRCEKSGKDGTMGFFVAGFVRKPAFGGSTHIPQNAEDDDDGWSGFDED